MNSILIKGIVRNGRVEIDEPINLPDGSEVTISGPVNNGGAIDADEEDGWDNSSEGVAAWLKWYDSLQPLIFSEKEAQPGMRIGKPARNGRKPILMSMPRNCGGFGNETLPPGLERCECLCGSPQALGGAGA